MKIIWLLGILCCFLIVACKGKSDFENGIEKLCLLERAKYCASLLPPYSLTQMFESGCLDGHLAEISEQCHRLYKEWQTTLQNARPIDNGGVPNSIDDEASIPMPIAPPKSSGNKEPHHKKPHHKKPNHPISPTVLAYRACHEDRVKFCPYTAVPYAPHLLFKDKCFQENRHKFTSKCQIMMEEFLRSHPDSQNKDNGPMHFILSNRLYVIMVLFGFCAGTAGVLLIALLVGCCVHICSRRSRKNKRKQSGGKQRKGGYEKVNTDEESGVVATNAGFALGPIPSDSFVYTSCGGYPQYYVGPHPSAMLPEYTPSHQQPLQEEKEEKSPQE